MNRPTSTTRSSPKGVALLVVLGVIMAIAVVSLGFMARCDTELASGGNMAARLQMDQLAASGLEHARGLLLNPQEADGVFWSGDTALQLDPNSSDFYDVEVVADPNDSCTYEIAATAYRDRSGQKAAESRLEATLRLDPVVGVWTAGDLTFRQDWSARGDIYAGGSLLNLGSIDGDAFSDGLTGTITGRSNAAGALPLDWPTLSVTAFTSHYTTDLLAPGTLSSNLGPYNPARVFYCYGNLIIQGPVTVDGMLLVADDLVIRGDGVRLLAPKNRPAVYVMGNLILHGATDLAIEGSVIVDGHVFVGHDTDVRIVGGLFAQGEIVEATLDASGNANDAMLRNIPTWPGTGVLELDGVDQYLRTRDHNTRLRLTSEYTLSVWVEPAAVQKSWAGILCKTGPDGDRNHWVLQFDSTATELVVGHDTARWYTGIELAELIDTMHHVAVVRQADGIVSSYLDGTLRKTLDPNIPEELAFQNTLLIGDPGHLKIGADRTGSGSYVYQGRLDDVRIYARALDAAEVASPPDGDASLIGHWTFDATDGSQMHVAADPVRAAIETLDGTNVRHWGPAAGAFFRSVRRPQP